jgi:integrase
VVAMERVEPIRKQVNIRKMKKILKRNNYRDYLLFTIGINTGFRVSDILSLRVEDVKNKTHIKIKERKTGKIKKALINDKLRKNIDDYIFGKEQNEYLFSGRESGKITRSRAYQILRSAAEQIGLSKIGTHSLRKTFGYHHYRRHKDVALLQTLFNHSSPSITLQYIGINQDLMDQSVEDFYL